MVEGSWGEGSCEVGEADFHVEQGEVQSEALHPDTAPPCPAWGAVTLNRLQASRKPTQARVREGLAAVCKWTCRPHSPTIKKS